MNKSKQKFFLGFSLYLEHILPYEKTEEKARMKIPPVVHLGGGAYNIAKTLETLGVGARSLELFGVTGKGAHPQRTAIEELLKQEKFTSHVLTSRERPSTSYYLVPEGDKTWAFGDPGGEHFNPSPLDSSLLKNAAGLSNIRILTEIRDNEKELVLAKLVFKKTSSDQINVLIPAIELLQSKKMHELIKYVDLLSLNETEARVLFGKGPRQEAILTFPTKYVFITRGANEAWLKAEGRIFTARPRMLKSPKFIGGAGDAATAALVRSLFYKGESPLAGLRMAVEIGTKTLQLPTSYYQQRKTL